MKFRSYDLEQAKEIKGLKEEERTTNKVEFNLLLISTCLCSPLSKYTYLPTYTLPTYLKPHFNFFETKGDKLLFEPKSAQSHSWVYSISTVQTRLGVER